MLDDYSGLGGCHSRILDRWTATQAAPKAPQRKRPCRSRALSLILTVELRVGEPQPGARSVSHRLRPTRSGVRSRVAAFTRPFPSKKARGTLMAIHSKHLETLEAVIATALNIVKNRPLADLYARRDFTGDFRIRVQLESGQRYVITIREER